LTNIENEQNKTYKPIPFIDGRGRPGKFTARAYRCGCGKDYASVQCLYQHIRIKHDGKRPEGTSACVNYEYFNN
jgi:hypothetical protein